ncbi:MAG: PqqD family protein, partial [Acidobacteria bacterium]|nr:PqqD family protein [Acidobacteriota bacterium]
HTNATGSRIWELLEQGRSLAEIIEILQSEYGAPADQLHQETEAFVEQLSAEKMIHRQGEGS